MSLKLCVLPLLLSVLVSGVTARADEHSDIVPYVTDDVIAIAYLDLRMVDVESLLEEMRTLGVLTEAVAKDSTRQLEMLQGWLQQLVDLGMGRVYVLLRTADLQHAGTSWVIPLPGDADADAVMRLLNSFLPSEFQRVDGAVLAARNREQLQRLAKTRTAPSREDSMSALDALGRADAALIVMGDSDSRRVLREMLPPMPAPFQKIDGRMVADELRWGGLAVNLPPKLEVVVRIETARPDTAITLRDSAVQLLELAEASPLLGLAVASPELQNSISKVLELIEPQANGTALTLKLGNDADHRGRLRAALARLLAAGRGPAERNRRVNQFKQLALAACNYELVHGSIVQSANYDGSGAPLLSWRVHLLPYLEESALYAEFHLDEPWNSSHNRKLIERMPQVYADPSRELRQAIGAGRTTFLAPIASETLFPPRKTLPDGKPLRIRDVKDGTSKTILFVEAAPDQAVVWTKPVDWNVSLDDPLRGVADPKRPGFVAAFADAHVKYIENSVTAEKLRAWLTRAGADVAD